MTERTHVRAVLIAGPTASGKSVLAVELARATGGVVINADSMQVYRDLRILTARPTPDQEAEAPHRLYGHIDAAINCSVGIWLDDARYALAAVDREGRLPIFVGGNAVEQPLRRTGAGQYCAHGLDQRAIERRRSRIADQRCDERHDFVSR